MKKQTKTEYICEECERVWESEEEALGCEEKDRIKKLDAKIHNYLNDKSSSYDTQFVKKCFCCAKILIEYENVEDGDRFNAGGAIYYDKKFIKLWVNDTYCYYMCLDCLLSRGCFGGAEILYDLEQLGYREFLERNVAIEITEKI